MNYFHIPAILLVLLISWTPSPIQARSPCIVLKAQRPEIIGVIRLVTDGSLTFETIERAIGPWKECSDYGLGFPTFQLGGEDATRTIHVRSEVVATDGATNRCGLRRGNEIVVYRFALGPRHERLRCGPLVSSLTHELGHVLGLADTPAQMSCSTHVMSRIFGTSYHRWVTEETCQAVSKHWISQSARVSSS